MAFTRTRTQGEQLSDAARRGDHLRVAQLLAEGAPLDWVENGAIARGQSALHQARAPVIVRLLLDAGADARVRDEYGRTPLHYAHDADAIQLLIAAGADLNARSDNGSTLLHHILCGEDADGSQLAPLLQLPGIDVNTRDGSGRTPVWFALRGDERRADPDDQVLAKLLVQAGADLDDQGAIEYRQAHPPASREFEEIEDEDSEARTERWELWNENRKRPDPPWNLYSTPREYARGSGLALECIEELERIANSWKTARTLDAAMAEPPQQDRATAQNSFGGTSIL